MDIGQKYDLLREILVGMERVVVAYSGGVDSTFLLKAAVETLGAENVLACVGVSASLARVQYEQAVECARVIGATLEEVNAGELSDANYAANKADRCFHCKSHLFGVLLEVAKEKGYGAVVCGANFDDKDDYRPGNRAADALGVRAPLMEAEFTKADVREKSRELGLPTADMPASPCLASRVSYGLEITEKRLSQVEQAEDFLRSLGLREFRVRHHDTVARIEVAAEKIEFVTSPAVRTQVVEKLKSLGFKFVTVDLQGFRSGALNEALSTKEKEENR